jgi:hypothetical protein
MSYLKTIFSYVAPMEYILGHKFGKSCSFMYIPIISTLQKLLSRADILGEIDNPLKFCERALASFDDSFCIVSKYSVSKNFPLKLAFIPMTGRV